MNIALTLTLFWMLTAGALALLAIRGHPVVASLLIATGIPILGLVTWEHGPTAGSVALMFGLFLLLWPLDPASHRLRRWLGKTH